MELKKIRESYIQYKKEWVDEHLSIRGCPTENEYIAMILKEMDYFDKFIADRDKLRSSKRD